MMWCLIKDRICLHGMVLSTGTNLPLPHEHIFIFFSVPQRSEVKGQI